MKLQIAFGFSRARRTNLQTGIKWEQEWGIHRTNIPKAKLPLHEILNVC